MCTNIYKVYLTLGVRIVCTPSVYLLLYEQKKNSRTLLTLEYYVNQRGKSSRHSALPFCLVAQHISVFVCVRVYLVSFLLCRQLGKSLLIHGVEKYVTSIRFDSIFVYIVHCAVYTSASPCSLPLCESVVNGERLAMSAFSHWIHWSTFYYVSIYLVILVSLISFAYPVETRHFSFTNKSALDFAIIIVAGLAKLSMKQFQQLFFHKPRLKRLEFHILFHYFWIFLTNVLYIAKRESQ